jgi:hypothetical protein
MGVSIGRRLRAAARVTAIETILYWRCGMGDMERRIAEEQERLRQAGAAVAASAEASRTEAQRSNLFLKFQTTGIPLRDAYFLSDEARYEIAGLVASFRAAGRQPEKLSRSLKKMFRPATFVHGWLVRFPRTKMSHSGNDDVGHPVDDTEALIVTVDYTVISAKTLYLNQLGADRLYPEDFAGKSDVITTIVKCQITWAEPEPRHHER